MRVSVIVCFLMLMCGRHTSAEELHNTQGGLDGLQQASRGWKDAIAKRDINAIVDLAEEPSTKQALRESLRDPNDILAKYFFGDTHSVRMFFSGNKNLTTKIIRAGETRTFYVCYYDPYRFGGGWSLSLLRIYSMNLDSIVCERSYESNGKRYLDFDMPIFYGD